MSRKYIYIAICNMKPFFELLGIAKKNYPHVSVFHGNSFKRLMKAFALDQVEKGI